MAATAPSDPTETTLTIIVTPHFNMAATASFIDPMRVANYLDGRQRIRWAVASLTGGLVPASNGLSLDTIALRQLPEAVDIAMVSSSWTPESHAAPALLGALRRLGRFGAALGALDTGAFLLAEAGLMRGHRATVHYEHMDAFRELYPDVELVEDLYVIDRGRISCCGGAAASDLALQILRARAGDALANASARYVFHDRLRGAGERQQPAPGEPLGAVVPAKLRAAIDLMEQNLEEALSIPEIARAVALSHRQLERLFRAHVRASPLQYYRDVRLDRARGLVTQTDMPVWEIAVACGFSGPEHFSRAYRGRFGLSPRADRVEGRVPFEFRAWPMPRSGGTSERRGGAS